MAQNLFANSAGTDRASLQDWVLEASSRTLTMREICAGLLQSGKEVPNKTNQWTSLKVDHIPRFVQKEHLSESSPNTKNYKHHCCYKCADENSGAQKVSGMPKGGKKATE